MSPVSEKTHGRAPFSTESVRLRTGRALDHALLTLWPPRKENAMSITDPTLRRLIHHLVATSLASPVLLAGCGGDSPPPLDMMTTPATYTSPLCVGTTLSLAGLNPVMPADYLELRQRTFSTAPRVLAQEGSKCSGATDKMSCAAKFDALPTQPGFHQCVDHDCAHSVAMTRGDDAQAFVDAPQLTAFLKPVDTPQEAALLAFANEYNVSCSDPTVGGVRVSPTGSGYEVLADRMTKDCDPIEYTGYTLHVSPDGVVTVLSSKVLRSTPGVCVGRRPEGLEDAVCAAGSPVGDYFAEVAHLEAASVAAFEQLAAELRAHGAPPRLVRAALRAARDEVRHARVTAALARRYGGQVRAPSVKRPAIRALEAVALENAAEGCVREAFGAVVGAWQARTAQDPRVARAMAVISLDEIRHAALAFQVAAWAETRLGAGERSRVRAAQREALAQLRLEVRSEPPREVSRLAGVPGAAQAAVLVEGMAQQVWERAA